MEGEGCRRTLARLYDVAPFSSFCEDFTLGGSVIYHGLSSLSLSFFFFLHDLYDLLRNNSTKATTRQKDRGKKKKAQKGKGEETKKKIGDTKGLNNKRKEKEKKEKED